MQTSERLHVSGVFNGTARDCREPVKRRGTGSRAGDQRRRGGDVLRDIAPYRDMAIDALCLVTEFC